MTVFALWAAFAVAVTLLLLLRPFLWRKTEAVTASHRQLNAAIYRDQFAELERDRAEGTLTEADYEQARMELQRRVLEDGRDDETPAAVRAPKKTTAALALLVPLAAIGLYTAIGTPAALNPQAVQQRFSTDEIERLVGGLAAKLEKEPDNLQGWVMLGRSYKAMRRFPEAEKAFQRAIKLVDTDAQMLAEYADLAAVMNEGSFAGKPAMLIEKALKLDPENMQARWLSGSAAFQRGDFAAAIADWEKLLTLLPPESEDVALLKQSIAQARTQAGVGAGSEPAKKTAR